MRRSLVEASLNNIEVEILGSSTKAPCPGTTDPVSSPLAPVPTTPLHSTTPTCIQSPPLSTTTSLATTNHLTPLQPTVMGVSGESTSPVLPVFVGSNSEQQAIMMGRLMETVNLMQQKMEKMEKQIQKLLLANKKVHVCLYF